MCPDMLLHGPSDSYSSFLLVTFPSLSHFKMRSFKALKLYLLCIKKRVSFFKDPLVLEQRVLYGGEEFSGRVSIY